MDPFELLKKDHEKVSALFKQIEAASGQAKLRIFRQLKNELDVHAHVEETIFYPALEREPQTRDITREAYEEHRVVKDLLAQLDAARSANEEWDARLTVLKENVEHHVEEEEGELFDKASDVLTGDEAEQLGDQMQAEKNRQTSGSPRRSSQGAAAPRSTKRKKPGLIKTIANALGFGSSESRASKKTRSKKMGSKKPTKTTKKAIKSSKKSRTTSKKAAAKRSPTTKKTTKRTTAKRGQKTSKRAAKR